MIIKNEIITDLEIKSVKDLYKLKPFMEDTSLKINKSQIARELDVDRRTVDKYINGYETKITKNSIKDALANGYEVIVNVQDGKVGNTYYEGHYYTILEIEKGTDNVFVADPGPVSTKLKNNGWYDIDELTGIKNVFYLRQQLKMQKDSKLDL